MNSIAERRGAGASAVRGVLMLLGLALGLVGCSGGGDSGSLEPRAGSDAAPPSVPSAEQLAVQNLLDLYQTAVLQEDIDQLQALLTADGGAEEGRSVLTSMSETFRRFAVSDLQLQDRAMHGSPTPQAVTSQEVLNVVDPATFEQQTQSRRTRWVLDRQTDLSGTVTLRLAEVTREGPQFEVTMRGQVVAGLPTRIEVAETTGGLAIAGVQVTVPETGTVHALVSDGPVWQGILTPPAATMPQPLQVRIQGTGGEELLVRHPYRLRRPGEGVVQPVAGTGLLPLSAVAIAPEGTVWVGGGGGGTLWQVAPGASTAQGVVRFSRDLRGQVVDLAVDQLGRLHAIVLVSTPNGVTANQVIVMDQGRFCATVNVFDPAYPLRAPDLRTGALVPSASTRAVAAGGGDIWLFGSDGGVALVTDAFRDGGCPENRVEVRYGPVFRRETGELLANTVPALRVGRDGALWLGSALGLTRLQGQQVTHLPFDPALSLRGDAATLEAFFQEVAQALFEARPLTTVTLGTVSFLAAFGRPLVKEDLIFSLAEDGRGRLWVGTLGGGLRRLEGGRDILHVTRREGFGSNFIFALTVGPEGSLWAATEEGVSRIREGNGELSITNFSALDGLPRLPNGGAAPVRDVAVGPDGTVWLATDTGLVRLTPQGGVVRGSIVDRNGQPVAGADITVAGTPFRAVTDAEGGFVLANLPSGPALVEVDGSRAAGGPFAAVVRQVTVPAGEENLGRVVLPPRGSLQLIQVAGDRQTAVVGHSLSQPLVVAVRDAQGQPAPDIPIRFTLLAGQGTLTPTLVPTGPDGQAATRLTPGTRAGHLQVVASGGELNPVVFTVTAMADRSTAQLIPVSGNNQVGRPGEDLPQPLVVQLEDQFGNALGGESVRAMIIQGEGTLRPAVPPVEPSGGALPHQSMDEQTSTNAQGRAAFRLQVGSSAESIEVELRAASLPQVPPVHFLTVIGLISPRGIAVEVNHSLVVVDRDLRAVVRVDPVKGGAAIVADANTGSGPSLIEPLAIAVEATGTLVVVDASLGAVLRVDPRTGERMVMSGCAARDVDGRCVGGIIGSGPPFEIPEAIAVEATGTLVVVDTELGAVLRVDPHTGDRTPVSGCAALDAEKRCAGGIIGPGPAFVVPKVIAVEAAGALVVADDGLGAVMRVNAQTGERTPVSGCPGFDLQRKCLTALIGDGPSFLNPWGIAIESTGALVVTDLGLRAVVRVDPHTGDRTPVSGCAALDAEKRCAGGNIGAGSSFISPVALVVETAQSLVVVDAGLGLMVRVDPHTGDRAIVRLGVGRGDGPELDRPTGLAVEAAGSLVVTDTELEAVLRVDPRTGDRTPVSGCAALYVGGSCVGGIIGGGPPFNGPAALAIEATGLLVVVDRGLGAVLRVDPHTGERRLVSGCPAIQVRGNCPVSLIGGGPPFRTPWGIAVEATGALVVIDGELKAVLRVDPHTGERKLVSGCPAIDAQPKCLQALIGEGPSFVVPADIAIEATGTLVVVDTGLRAVVRVDPHTGQRTLVSGCSATDGNGQCVGEIVGRDFPFDFPQSVVVEVTGSLLVVDSELDAIVRVDPVTGDRERVSDARIGRGLPLIFPVAMAVEAAGSLVVLDGGLRAVIRVDPDTGDRAIVSVGAE